MTEHEVGTREEHQAAREALLAKEKELTHRSDELARERRALPWVPIDKEYRFETDDGTKTLAELFDGRSQLLVYHFMFGPEYTAGCPRGNCGDTPSMTHALHWARRITVDFSASGHVPQELQAYVGFHAPGSDAWVQIDSLTIRHPGTRTVQTVVGTVQFNRRR